MDRKSKIEKVARELEERARQNYPQLLLNEQQPERKRALYDSFCRNKKMLQGYYDGLKGIVKAVQESEHFSLLCEAVAMDLVDHYKDDQIEEFTAGVGTAGNNFHLPVEHTSPVTTQLGMAFGIDVGVCICECSGTLPPGGKEELRKTAEAMLASHQDDDDVNLDDVV